MPRAARLWARYVALVSVICPNNNSVPQESTSARMYPPLAGLQQPLQCSIYQLSLIIPLPVATSLVGVQSHSITLICQRYQTGHPQGASLLRSTYCAWKDKNINML